MPRFPIRYEPPRGVRFRFPRLYRRNRFGKFILGLSVPEWGILIFAIGGIIYLVLDRIWWLD